MRLFNWYYWFSKDCRGTHFEPGHKFAKPPSFNIRSEIVQLILLILKARLCLIMLIPTRYVQRSAEESIFEPGHKFAKPPTFNIRNEIVQLIQSNLALRNFLVTTKKFLQVKSSLFQTFNQSKYHIRYTSQGIKGKWLFFGINTFNNQKYQLNEASSNNLK